MVQAGAQPYECQEPEEQSKLESEGKVVIYREARKEIALRIAETIVAVREAPAFKAQLALLQEETPESAIKDRRELKAMIPLAFEKVEAMLSDESSLELMELRNILADAGGMPAAAADKQSESSDGSDDSQGSGMIQRPAGFDLLRPGGSRSFTQAYE
mmetsp:Transcript_15347/g.26264  ORF Transcript_15347/g.26264 Transcript_15347/m.26264 type:complete len:158 (+) Transcript_15347:77-550(+)